MSAYDHWYEPYEAHGVTASIVAACISFVSVAILLSLLAWSAITGRGPTERPFLRTHIGIYFVSLMTTDLVQSIGGIMSIRWVAENHLSPGRYCTAQAVLKHSSSVSAAFWSAVIALHTLRMLLFNAQANNILCVATLIVTWSAIVTIVAIGPTAIQTTRQGEFYGMAGYWCWITDKYTTQRLFMQYFLMFLSALTSTIVYTMIFFRLRGNLVAERGRLRIIRTTSCQAWNLEAGRASMEVNTMKIAWQLMWYPISYTLMILPLTITRWAVILGHKVPFPAMMFASVVFQLCGFVNTVLFITTRHVLPPFRLRRKSASGSESAISISVHATHTQEVSFAKGHSPYTVAFSPLPKTDLEIPALRLGGSLRTASSVEKGHKRLSDESGGVSFTDMVKGEDHRRSP